MSKLTLPIVAGKKYIRRDGKIVVPKPGSSRAIVEVDDSYFHQCVFIETGRNSMSPSGGDFHWDLVADYIEEPVGHPHADLMMQYAEDAKTDKEPWNNWEYSSDDIHWNTIHNSPAWLECIEYRRKPSHLLVNGVKVPAPLKVAPKYGTEYWIPHLDSRPETFLWENDLLDQKYLRLGLIHLTEEAAQEHTDALLLPSKI